MVLVFFDSHNKHLSELLTCAQATYFFSYNFKADHWDINYLTPITYKLNFLG